MPQKAKGHRLYLRKDTGIWIIRDTGRGDCSTGARDRREAETALALYITERDRPRGPASADEMSVSEALNIYLEQHAPTVADPARIAYAAVPLIGFWGDLPVSAIKRETCGAYGRKWVKVVRRDRETGEPVETAPVSVGTIRKDLGVLASTLSFCEAEGRLLNAPKVALPKKPPAKDRWLTRDEAARLVRAAWRNPTSKHLAKFILVALYAGTRKTAILRLRFMPHLSGGHVDIERGKLYRRGATQAETKKRQPPITITPRLLAHLRRWEHLGKGRWVVDYRGNGVSSIKTAWNTAVKDAGLDGTGVNPHTLLHTAITWTMQAGGDIYEAAGYFGVSIETMFDVYAHHHPDHQRDAVAAVGRGGRKL